MGRLVAIEIIGKSAHVQQDDRMPPDQHQVTNIGDPTINCQNNQHHQRTHQQLHLRLVQIVPIPEHVEQDRDEEYSKMLYAHRLDYMTILLKFEEEEGYYLLFQENEGSLIQESLSMLFVSSD